MTFIDEQKKWMEEERKKNGLSIEDIRKELGDDAAEWCKNCPTPCMMHPIELIKNCYEKGEQNTKIIMVR